jgi:hypothetical protein
MIAMRPVEVWESSGVKRTLTTVESAAEFLVERWPQEHRSDPLYLIAQQVALDILEGNRRPNELPSLLSGAASLANALVVRDLQAKPDPVLLGHIAKPWRSSGKKQRRR